MAGISDRHSFFSVSVDLILTKRSLPYDLYINSSGNVDRDKFIRIFPAGDEIDHDELLSFKRKYFQLYVLENQRGDYLKSFIQLENVKDLDKGEVIKDSAIHYLGKLFDPSKEFTTEVLNETIEGCRDSVESMVDLISDYNIDELKNLIAGLSFHDFYTYDHSINVSMYTISIFKMLKPDAPKIEITQAGMGGLLHDLGKIKIPTSILNNPGKLTDEQFEEIKKHPGFGKELIQTTNCSCHDDIDFSVVERVIHEHHENFNGTGYPQKIEGLNIHIMARVVAIADFFDAITTKRSYHEVLSISDALTIMDKTAGKKIDPHIFSVFRRHASDIVQKTSGKVCDLEIDESFDPCQPHNVLPFVKSEKKEKKKLNTDKDKKFGSVSSTGDLFSNANKKKKMG